MTHSGIDLGILVISGEYGVLPCVILSQCTVVLPSGVVNCLLLVKTAMSEIGKQWLPPATSRAQPTRGGPPAWGPAPPRKVACYCNTVQSPVAYIT
jgi:hypothetical protein